MDWVDPISSKLAEDKEGDMSSLTVGIFTLMCKRAASVQGETNPSLEVSGDKPPKWSGLDEEAHKSLTVIIVDSPK